MISPERQHTGGYPIVWSLLLVLPLSLLVWKFTRPYTEWYDYLSTLAFLVAVLFMRFAPKYRRLIGALVVLVVILNVVALALKLGAWHRA
jgi:hypothetical protein